MVILVLLILMLLMLLLLLAIGCLLLLERLAPTECAMPFRRVCRCLVAPVPHAP